MNNIFQLPKKTQKQSLAEATKIIRQDQAIIENLVKTIVYLKSEIEDIIHGVDSTGDAIDARLRDIHIKSEMLKVYGTNNIKELPEGSVLKVTEEEWIIKKGDKLETMKPEEVESWIESITGEKGGLIVT